MRVRCFVDLSSVASLGGADYPEGTPCHIAPLFFFPCVLASVRRFASQLGASLNCQCLELCGMAQRQNNSAS